MDKKRSISVLFLGSIQRNEEYPVHQKPTDEIDFGRPVRVTLLRIPKPKRELYGKLTSITQSEPIKGFEIYFRNLEETSGRYSLLTCSNDFMITSTQDVLITPQRPFLTDLLVIRGAFYKLSLCVYGDQVEPSSVGLWSNDAPINEAGMAMEIKRNIFLEKRKCIQDIEAELEEIKIPGRESINLSTADIWQEATNDDDINEPQIKNICNISQHLLNTFQQITEDQYIVKFRQNIENINNHLQKLFKSKQIGLYYPKQHNYTIQTEIPLPLVHIGLTCLKLGLSDQFRVLEMLKMLAQLPRHAHAIIEAGGVAQLESLFIQFYKPGAVFFSTFKNLVLEVCIALAQWSTAAQKMVTKLQEQYFDQVCKPLLRQMKSQEKKDKQKQKELQKQKEKQKQKQKQKSHTPSRSRSRDKGKQKKSKSVDSSSSDDDGRKKKDKKDKKEKKDKKKKDKEKQKSKKRDKQKYGDDKKEKDKKKDKDKQKQKIREKEKDSKMIDEKQKVKKEEFISPCKIEAFVQDVHLNKISFYQLLFFILIKEKNSKTLNLIKILIQQITQTLTRNKQVSEQLANTTAFLRDTKFLFNQGSEIINSKSLKIFASFQPFLNDNQSEDVDCKYISEKQKLKNPLRYNISPKIFKIISKLNRQIVSNAHKEQLGIGTPFDENFLVMVSELIFQKQKPILSGFNRIVNAFKSDGLMHLQRNEATISIVAEYIYKALLDDQGTHTFAYIDQIYSSLIKFVALLNEDPSLFSTQLKSRIKMLSNYATPYDYFGKADGNFKYFCEYFLKLFKYENYQIEINNKAKLTDFKKKQYEKLVNPFTFDNLNDNYSLKNFNQVSSSQPLLQIDVCLKIFLVLCEYNKNIWTSFYENRLISGFTSLLNKISNLVLFMLQHSPNRWTSYASMKSFPGNIDNYLTVIKHILMLLSKKCRYESAYNDLLEEDIFEDVELYEKSIQIYIHLFNALHDEKLMVYLNKTKNKIKVILGLTIEIIDQFLTSYELIVHQTRQQKLRRMLDHIYITHYESLKSRPAIISIYGHILKLSEGATCRFLASNLLDSHFTLNKLFQNDVAYIPSNQKSMIENILRTNLYRADPVITNNLGVLVKTLFAKTQYVDKALDILQRLFNELDQEYKKNEQQLSQISWKNLRKTHLFTEVLVKSQVTLKSRLDDKLMRYFKRIVDSFRRRAQLRQSLEKEDQENFIIYLKTKNNFMIYFTRLLKQSGQNSTILLQFFEWTAKSLNLEYYTLEPSEGHFDFVRKVNSQALKACQIYTRGLSEISLVCTYQCFLLYREVLQKPYKLDTFLGFSEIFALLEKIVLKDNSPEYCQQLKTIKKIVNSIFYFLCCLTTINGSQLFTTESRRGAIIYLMNPSERQFPFNAIKSSILFKFINKEFIKLLEEYFSYPIVEKAIIIPVKNEPKIPGKTKSAIYSKTVFNIISEHQAVSKARYKFIGGQWVGGDVKQGLYTPFRVRNYDEQIEKYLLYQSKAIIVDYKEYHLRQYSFMKDDIVFNELFYLSIRKDRQEMQKKQIDRTIQLKDVLPRLTPQESKKQMKPSPSPSKIINPMGVNHMSPQSGINPLSMGNPLLSKQTSGSNDKNYNRNSNPRSNSQGNSQPNYSSGSSYSYNNSRPPATQQQPIPPVSGHYNHGMMPNPMPNYNTSPPVVTYPPQYYNPPPPGMYAPNPHQRYPYPPASMGYPPGPSSLGKPMAPNMYSAPGMHPTMGQPPNSQYQEQMFQEAYILVNQLKSSNGSLSQPERTSKMTRLNYILSNYPKFHSRLKDMFAVTGQR